MVRSMIAFTVAVVAIASEVAGVSSVGLIPCVREQGVEKFSSSFGKFKEHKTLQECYECYDCCSQFSKM